MSLALNSAQQNLAKVIAGKAEKEALKEQKKQDEEDGHQTTENYNTPAPEEDEEEDGHQTTENYNTPAPEEDEEEDGYTGVISEGVEYLVNEETGEILDPDNFEEMGSWNADTQSIVATEDTEAIVATQFADINDILRGLTPTQARLRFG